MEPRVIDFTINRRHGLRVAVVIDGPKVRVTFLQSGARDIGPFEMSKLQAKVAGGDMDSKGQSSAFPGVYLLPEDAQIFGRWLMHHVSDE